MSDIPTEGNTYSYLTPADFDRVPDYDPRSGAHLWVMAAMFQVNPDKTRSGEVGFLDRENLVLITGPGCFYCEQVYRPRVAHRRCPGPAS